MNKLKHSYLIAMALLTMVSCANRGIGPQGGPKDEDPPVVVKETPLNGSLNYTDKVVELVFDEYVQLNNVADNVLISPPQIHQPEVKAIGKRVTVKFEDDLQDSTTYTIDFGSAICDLNEKNALEDYSFSFSTGDVIDSLEVSGLLLNAENLNIMSKIVIGVHTDLTDSALSTLPFVRIAKTNSEGRFRIKNLKTGDYRIYALNDVSNDYKYEPGEGLSLYDSIITPYAERHIASDTIWRDSISSKIVEGERVRDTVTVIDTIITKERTFYHPDDIVLLYFQEDKTRQYFVRALREKQHFFTLLFNAPQDSLPIIKPIGEEDWSDRILIQPSAHNDTITVWLRDSSVISIDTLQFEMTYMKTDSVYELQPVTDTIRAIYRAPRISASAKAKMERDKQQKQTFLDYKTNNAKGFDIYKPFVFTFSTPIDSVFTEWLHVYEMQDTVRVPIKTELQYADSAKMNISIVHEWKAETTYRVEIDSACFKDIYGVVTDKRSMQFTTRSLDEYSTLIVRLEPYVEDVVVQILNEKDAVIREMPMSAEGAKFEYLKPESYYMRAFVDSNHDGKWTTGDYMSHRKPEAVYYFPQKLTLRANWDFEEVWNMQAVRIEKQKPEELVKDENTKKK